MKKIILAALCVLIALCCTREIPDTITSSAIPAGEAGPAVDAAPHGRRESQAFVPGEAIVYVSEALAGEIGDGAAGVTLQKKFSEEFRLMASRIGATSFTRLFPNAGEYEPRTRAEGLHRWFIVEYDKNVSISGATEMMEAVPGIQRVEPNYVLRQTVDINDPYWDQMWGQNNTRYPGYDVNCKPVWDGYTMGNTNVVVAVVDGGFQLDHPDLAANAASGGHYNYVRHNSTISQHFHGTHVAGTIAAVNNNGKGVTGIAGGNSAAGKGGVKLLSLQVFETLDNGQDASASNFATALKEAADRGAHISQNSWGYNFDFNDDGKVEGAELNYARNAHENPERSFTQAVDYFNKYAGCDNNGNQLPGSPMKGGIVIFAAGNDDIPYGAPGNYDGCVSVGAINVNGARASFSNYGDWVDICAPGVNIPSTYLSGQYVSMSGTSMACPHVSGVAALIASYFGGQGFTADELRARLLGGAKVINASNGSKPVGPLADAMGSFQVNASSGAPSQVTGVEAVTVGHNIRVDFPATNAYGYIVLSSTQKSAIQEADYQNPASNVVYATKIASSTDVEGTPQTVMLAGLKPSTDYYVAVAAYSYDKKYSELSDILQVHTEENIKPVIDVADYPAGGYEFRHHEIISIPVTFTDPDGDAITVTFDSKGSRATLEPNNGSEGLYNFKLMCPLVTNPGTFSSIVKAQDEVGATAVQTIQFKVLPNNPPVQTKELPMFFFDEVSQQKTLNLEEYFTDPDEEPLLFRAVSLNDAIATASLDEDGTLHVTAKKQGVCDIKVSAEDHDGEKVSLNIRVLMRPKGTPEVFLSGKTVITEGSITIISGVEDAPTSVRLISSSGVVVYELNCNTSAANPLELNFDNLAPGIYTLEVTYKGETYSYTIVKR